MSGADKALKAIRDAVGTKGWIGDGDGMEPYLDEERGLYHGACAAVVRPATTEEVAKVVEICSRAGLAVVPQGGNTGLVGGGVPDGGIVLSTVRLNRIREIDAGNLTMTAEAGVVLADIRAAADEAGCLFPLSLGAEGSCRIGGNLSTNAGGSGVLRYGAARDLALGLEVVLPDGRVWDGLGRLRKDNTGYDLKQLFIGAEGTLGIITAAVLKLFPRPQDRATALAAAADLEKLLELFSRIHEPRGGSLVAFEVMSRICVDFATEHVAGVIDPLRAKYPYYGLIELAGSGPGLGDALETVLGTAFDDGLLDDAVIAASGAQARQLWRLREAIPEAQKHEGGSIKHDIAVPVSKVPEFIARATAMVERELPGIRACAFGHLGDGNIHFNLSQPIGMDKQVFLGKWRHFNRLVHDLAMDMEGSFSAEHGIGKLKREDLARYKSEVELDLMRKLKTALDPKGIMNPGKVVDGF